MGFNQYGIEIEINSKKLRYGTDRLATIQATDCGESLVTFKPYIVKFVPPKGTLSFDSKMPVTKMSVSIWDGYRELNDSFSNGDYGNAVVTVFFFDDEGVVIGTQVGYMTDMSYAESIASFTIRTDENKANRTFLKQYSYDSFQYFEVLQIKNVVLGKHFTVNEQTPWRVMAREVPRTYLDAQQSTFGGTLYPWFGRGLNVFPDAPYIRTKTTNNNYSKRQITTTTDLSSYETLSQELTLKDTSTTIFPSNPQVVPTAGVTPYYIANLGNTEGTQVTGVDVPYRTRHEQFKYAYFLKNYVYDWVSNTFLQTNDDQYWFSGIPNGDDTATGSTRGARDPIAFYSADGDRDDLYANYGIKERHNSTPISEIVSPAGKFDVLWIKSGGQIPYTKEDPEIGVGYLWAGRTQKHPIRGTDIKVYHRYAMTNIPTDGLDAGPPYRPATDTVHFIRDVYDDSRADVSYDVLRLEMHNKFLDPAHIYAVGPPQTPAWEIRKGIDDDDELQLVNFEYIVSHVDIHLTGMDAETFEEVKLEPDLLKDRYRGLRVDMFESFESFVEELSSSQAADGTKSAINAVNNNLLNNASGKFAICTGSEFIIDESSEYVERLYFKVDEQAQGQIGHVVVDDPDEGSSTSIGGSSSDDLFMNNLTVHHGAENVDDWADSSAGFSSDAAAYFLRQRYRVIHDPVPENGKDLGAYFPIVYGFVHRVPMIQAISKKTFGSDESTAGDDTYIFASHKCDVYKPSDILIEVFGDAKTPDRSIKEEDYSYLIADSIIKSPFPNVVDGHFEIFQSQFDGDKFRSVGKLNYPYHKVIRRRTLDGDLVYGVKLRGDEWDDRVDRYDKRFPIRNGVGSSQLYASYGGYKDGDGQLVSHPLDIIEHFVKTYGESPHSLNMLDLDNIEAIKALTRKYQASVFIKDEIDISTFIFKMTRQFGMFPFLWNGKVLFSSVDPDFVDHSKPISEGLNLLEGVKEVSKGYTEMYSVIEFNYRKNWVTGKFDKRVSLNETNNRYCAESARSRSAKKTFKIDADWVYDAGTAKEVALRYARLLSSRRREYECEVKYIEGIEFVPGDVVPLTDLESNIDNEPVVVKSVQQFRTTAKLTLIRLG